MEPWTTGMDRREGIGGLKENPRKPRDFVTVINDECYVAGERFRFETGLLWLLPSQVALERLWAMVSWSLARLEPLSLTRSDIASRGIVCECSVAGCGLVLDLDIRY